MKKSILSLVAIATLSLNLNAQIPNSGFENWTSMGSYDNPDSWSTLNDITTSSGVYTATKGTPGNPGSSYLKLTSKTVGPSVVNGIAVSGTFDATTMQPKSGFAYSGQPASLTGKWQHMIYGSSQGSISAMLTRWDATLSTRVTVATANVTLSGMAMSWANFTIPFNYVDSQAPDSCIIVLKASGTAPTNNDYLWVDNLAFTGSVAGLQENSNSTTVNLFPNPCSDVLNVSFEGTKNGTTEIELINAAGQVVQTKVIEMVSGKTKLNLTVSALPKGNYLLRFSSGNEVFTRTVVLK